MKKYKGMRVEYFQQGNKEEAWEKAGALYNSISSISLDLKIGKHPAFIVYCDELLWELCAIRSLNQEIWARANDLPTESLRQYVRQAVIEEIHQTNDMEDIHSTRKEISDEIRIVQSGKKSKRFDGMIRKYELLLEKKHIPLSSCQDIRDLYDSFVLEEVKMNNPDEAPDGLYFRKNPVSVMRHSDTIHEGVFPENILNQSMEQALSFLNNPDYDPMIEIAAFHYLIGYIHPFYNGNGRMIRFISSYALARHHIHLLVALRLSYVIKSHRAQYYKMFKSTNDSRNYGDLTRFVIDFLDFVREACVQIRNYMIEQKTSIDHYDRIVGDLKIDKPAKDLLFVLAQVSICEGESLSTKEIERICKISYYKQKQFISQIDPFLIISKAGKTLLYRADLQKLDEAKPGDS